MATIWLCLVLLLKTAQNECHIYIGFFPILCSQAELPQVFSDGSEGDISETKVPVKCPGNKSFHGSATTKVANDGTNVPVSI